MIAVALEAERRAWLDAHADVVDAAGHRLVVGNGYRESTESWAVTARVLSALPKRFTAGSVIHRWRP